MKAKKLLLMFVLALAPMLCMAQATVTSISLSGSGGSGVGTVGGITFHFSGEGGSIDSQNAIPMSLPQEVATALESNDIEDVELTIRNGKVEIKAEGEYTCNIYDITGKHVAMQNANQPVSIDLASGIYVVAITRQGKVVCARKISIK